MGEFVPRPYQKLIIDHILAHSRCAVWAGMGMGKTVSTLTALKKLKDNLGRFKTLIIAPLRVAKTTWPEEVRKWDHLRSLKTSVVCGEEAARLKALEADADIYITNYEQLPWLVEHFKEKWPFRAVVADESTRLKGFRTRQGTKRCRALASVSRNLIDIFIELTGTPSPNGLQDLWGQMWFLDHGVRLEQSFSKFQMRYFRPERVGADPWAVTWVPCSWSQDIIQKKVADLCISLDASDWFDIDKPIETVINVELPEKARELYKSMENSFLIELDCGEVEAVNAAVKTGKLLQLASGAVYTDDKGRWEEVHNAKLEALQSVVEEAAGMPVLVAYQFKSDLERLKKKFPKGRHLDKDPQTVKDWNEGKIPVLFAHPASAGHGLNLQDGGNILAVFSHGWNLEEYLQIVERIGPTRQKQAGHPRPVFIYQIVARDTMDELVLQRRKTKKEVQDILLSFLKSRS